MSTSVGRVNHLHLVVVDLGRSIAFYTQGLGFEECYTSASGVVFLRSPAHDSLALEEATCDRRPGVDHFGFALSDPDGLGVLVDKVVATGGGVLDQGELARGHPQALVTDPDGHVIRLRPG